MVQPTLLSQISPLDKPSGGCAYDPSNGYIYVTNYGSGTVSIISAPAQATKTYTVTFTESGLPAGTGQKNPGGYVKYTLDLINNTLINGNFVNTGNALEPWSIAYDPSNGYIYVADAGSGTVSVINGKTNTVIATIRVGSEPWGVAYNGVAYDPSNGYIYVTNWYSGWYSGTVSVINGTTVIATIPVGQGPWGVAYDPSNGYIYVADMVQAPFR